ncbi:MAG: glycosyltransferase family 2 protein [Thermoguttaceae bacterium]
MASKHHDDISQWPFISVIVPVRNEAASIERTLECLMTQDYDPPQWEVLVVDGHSDDATADLARRFAERHPALRVLRNPRRLSSAARNIGIRNARANADIVLIVDGHCEIEDTHYLRKLAAAFARSGADCVGRPQPLATRDPTPLQRAVAAARSSWLGHHPHSHVYSSQSGAVPAASVAVAYRRSVFDRVGWFDEHFDACEDVEFNHRIDRAGLRCYFAPEVAVRYAPRASLSGLLFQMMRYGRGRLRLLRKHPATLSLGSLLPLLFTVGLGVGLPLGFAAHWLAAAYLAAVVCYAAIVLVVSARIAWRLRDGRLLVRLPLVFVTVHLGVGIGMLLELVSPGRRWRAGVTPS